jgi:ketosteroid isomerase-like protein
MTQNKGTVERYLDGFRRSDHSQILSCLTDDVEWEIPGAFHVQGKEEFDKQIENEGFVGSPAITVTRLTEGDDVVVAEGSVRTQRKDGTFLNLAMCDVFEMQGGKIRRLISYLMETNERIAPAAPNRLPSSFRNDEMFILGHSRLAAPEISGRSTFSPCLPFSTPITSRKPST